MGLLNRIANAFRAPPKLRNRAGGMAWIKPYGHAHGADALAGHVVKTVALMQGGTIWLIDPPQRYIVSGCGVHCTLPGNVTAHPGDRVTVLGLADELLEPLKEDGITDSEVRDLFAPEPTKEPNRV